MKTIKVVLLTLILWIPNAYAEKPPFEAITWNDAVNSGYYFEKCHMWYHGRGECTWYNSERTIQQKCYLWDSMNLNKATVSCQLVPLTAEANVVPTIPSMNYEKSPATKIKWVEALALPGAYAYDGCYHEMHMQACQISTPTNEIMCRKHQADDRLVCVNFRIAP